MTASTPGEVPLVTQLVQASYDQYSASTRQLIASYEAEIDRLRATVTLIRERTGRALNGPYAPSARAITEAVYPPEQDIEHVAAGLLRDRESQ
jgi:hypothetical protein